MGALSSRLGGRKRRSLPHNHNTQSNINPQSNDTPSVSAASSPSQEAPKNQESSHPLTYSQNIDYNHNESGSTGLGASRDQEEEEDDLESDLSLNPAGSSPPTSTGSLPGTGLQLLNDCFTDMTLKKVVASTEADILASLARDASQPNMIPSCLKALPTGDENGTFWSIDLGGSTFRVALVTLLGREAPVVGYKSKAMVPTEIKQGKGADFFKWMASQILVGVEAVRREIGSVSTPAGSCDPGDLPMGLSWSFPITQKVLNRGEIRQMGKGYVVGKEITGWDLKDSFESALSALGLNIRVSAVVNDGAASMISHAFQDQSTRISLILGTGINAGVMLPMSVISKEKLASLALDPSFESEELANGSCLVNTEISMLGLPAGIPETDYDIELDSNLELPGFQPLETKVSGRYLGEISRLVIKDMILRGGMCSGQLPNELEKPYCVPSNVMADVEQAHRLCDFEQARGLLKTHLPFLEAIMSDLDLDRVCAVFNAVSSRSAAYTAAVLVALAAVVDVDKTGINCTVAYTGSVMESYPEFQARCQAYLDMLGAPRNIKLLLHSEKDGSLIGPAVAAAMHFE